MLKDKSIINATHVSGIVVLILTIAGCTSGCIDDTGQAKPSVRYYALIKTSGPIEILFPAPNLTKVDQSIVKDNGQGDINHVDNSNGRCIRISTNSRIEVSGTWFPGTDAERAMMTINLTTMIPNETAPYYFNNKTLPDRHVLIHISSTQNGTIILTSNMRHPSGRCYMFRMEVKIETLTPGWNVVLMDGSYYREYAP